MVKKVCLCIVLLSITVLVAQEEKKDIDWIAPTGVLTIYVPDCARLKDGWKNSFLGCLYGDEEFGDFLKSLDTAGFLPEKFLNHHFRTNAGVDLKDGLSVLNRGMVIHLSDLNAKESEFGKAVRLLLLLNCGDKKDLLRKILDNLAFSFSKSPPLGAEKFSASKTVHESVNIESFLIDKVNILNAFIGDIWALSFDAESIRGAIDTAKNKQSAPFVTDVRIKKLLSGVKESCNYDVALFGDSERIVKGLEGFVSNEVKEVLDEVLKLVPQFAYFATPKNKGYKETILIKYPNAVPQGLKDAVTIPTNLLAESERIFLYGLVSNGHLREWTALFRQMLDEVLREAPGENPLQRKPLAELEKSLEFSFEKDIVERISGTVEVYVVEPDGGGAFPEIFATAILKEPDKFIAIFEKMAQKINEKAKTAECQPGDPWWDVPLLRIKKTIIGELTLFAIDFVKYSGEKFEFPYTPTIGIVKGKIIFGTSPQTVRSVARTLISPLPVDETFKTVLKSAENKNIFVYLNLPRAAAYAYNTGVPALRSKYGKELKTKGVDLILLPDVRSFTRHFKPAFISASAKDSLYRIEVETEQGFGQLASIGGTFLYLGLSYIEHYFDPKAVELRKLAALDLKVVADLQKLSAAQSEFFKTEKKYASSIDELINKKLLAENFPENTTHKIQILGAGKGWSATANPRTESPLMRFYFINESGTIRISDSPQVGPNAKKWEPVSHKETETKDKEWIPVYKER